MIWEDPQLFLFLLVALLMIAFYGVSFLIRITFNMTWEEAESITKSLAFWLVVMVVLFGWFLPNLPRWTGSCVGSCIGDYQTAKQEALEEAKKKDEQPKQKEQKP